MNRLILVLFLLIFIYPVYSQMVVVTYDNSTQPDDVATPQNGTAIVTGNSSFTKGLSNTSIKYSASITKNGATNLTHSLITWTKPDNWSLINGSLTSSLGNLSNSSLLEIYLQSNYSNGTYNVILNFTSDQYNTTLTLPVEINTDSNPRFIFTFQNVTMNVNSSNSFSLGIQNTGYVSLNNISVSLTGLNSTWYTLPNVSTIGVGSLFSGNVQLRPTVIGNYSYNLSVGISSLTKSSEYTLTVVPEDIVVQNNTQNTTQNTTSQNSTNQQNQYNNGNPVYDNTKTGSNTSGSKDSKQLTVEDIAKQNEGKASQNSGLKIFGLVILTLVILGGVGYVAYRFLTNKKSKDTTNESSYDLISDIPSRKPHE